jgi:ATP-dependent DNA ligase
MFPNNLRPMPLKRHREPFSNPDWLFELKHDGFRALAFIQNGNCQLVSRNGNEFKNFSALASALPKELGAKAAVLDGEVLSRQQRNIPIQRSAVQARRTALLCFRPTLVRRKGSALRWITGTQTSTEGAHQEKRMAAVL